jgi:hypothetical protein
MSLPGKHVNGTVMLAGQAIGFWRIMARLTAIPGAVRARTAPRKNT